MRFRIDDYPCSKPNEFDRHNLESFKRFNEVMLKHGLSYDLGVIPVYTPDKDIRWLGQQENIRVAMHGVNHPERFQNEFREYQTESEIYAILRNEKGIMESEAGKPVDSYIPPHNAIDRKTVNALVRAKFKELHGGPGTDFDVSMYAAERGLHVVPSFPPFYGRSDEMLQRGAVPIILKEDEERSHPFCSKGELCICFHWTWENNIGFEHLDLFLSRICGKI
jgi:hypothetical protein